MSAEREGGREKEEADAKRQEKRNKNSPLRTPKQKLPTKKSNAYIVVISSLPTATVDTSYINNGRKKG